MKLKKLSFQKKIYLSCFTLNLILLSICSFGFYFYTAQSLRQNMQDTVMSNTSMLQNDLDRILKDADNILKDLQTNQELLYEVKNIGESADNYFTTHVPVSSKFQNTFRSLLVSQDCNGSVSYISRYYDNVGLAVDTGAHAYVQKDTLKSKAGITELLEETSYVTYLLPHISYWNQDQTVFSVARSMRDTYRQYGILKLDLNISILTNLLNDFESPENYSITLLDSGKKLVYTSEKDMDIGLVNTPQSYASYFYAAYEKAAKEADSGTFSSDNFTLSGYQVSGMTGWTFILSSSTANYLQSIKLLLVICAVVFFSLFIIMSTFLYMVTHRLVKPLKQLTSQLGNLEPGRNIHLRQISSDNEITLLTNAVQAFLAEIYDQNQRLTESRKRTLQAHYDAMEAQMNPHFLYNTLSVIGMAGLSSGNINVSKMCSELASLLRYSLSYTGQSVRLEMETTNAGRYLYIMKMRYEEALDYVWDLDPSLNSLLVPKLILQPLLENCFQHGFQQTEYEIQPPFRIKIQSHCDESYWYLSVTNNGAPFKEEKIQKLYQRIQQFELTEYMEEDFQEFVLRQGFGLENTILRLNIYYHGQEFFRISSPEPSWTTVTIGGPRNPSVLFGFKAYERSTL